MGELEVHVVSPEREVFAGQARMVVARGTDGDVGILPGHAPMLVGLEIAPLRVLRAVDPPDETVILVDGGFLHVTPGPEVTRVDVLAESAELATEADAAAAGARAEELRGRMDERADAGLEGELARAAMRAEHGRA